jgi:hypothetical protein
MATATTLAQAAGQSYDNLHIRWLANQLRSRLVLLCNTVLPTFPQENPDSNPVSNWITVLLAVSSQLPNVNVPINQLSQVAEILYRLCWMAAAIQGSGITNAQAAFLLAQINVIIGF